MNDAPPAVIDPSDSSALRGTREAGATSGAPPTRPRVGLLTYHFSDNFGAVMQAYALRRWFLRQGCTASFINYHPSYVEEGGDFVDPFNPARWRTNAKILYLRLSRLQRRLFGNRNQAEHFTAFQREELGVRGPRLERMEDLDRLDADYDLLVCGSDQIWNPSVQKGLDPAYFLAFGAAPAARRISYAASFGKATLDPACHADARRLLAGLDGISVREASGVGIVRDLCGRDAACVPDPTILLGDYAELLDGACEDRRNHVFCYALRTGEGIREVAELAAGPTGLQILSPYNVHRRWREIGETVHPSPKGWLALLAGARCVVTNSFHGTALSIVLERPFVVVGLPGARQGMNERVRNLLVQLDLTDRFVSAGDMETAKRCLATPIAWADVRVKLAGLRSLGEAYLQRELAEVVQR